MGGGGPGGPFLQLPTNIFTDPEQLRRLQDATQQLKLQQLQQDVKQLKSALEQSKAENAKSLIDALVQITSAHLDKATAYTNLIIVAGYGAFFALWSLVRNDLAPLPSTLVAILMMISVATFVFFEIYRMASTAFAMRGLNGLLDNSDGQLSVEVMQQRINEFKTRSGRINLSFNKAWELTLLVCVSTGAFAGLITLRRAFVPATRYSRHLNLRAYGIKTRY